MNKKIIGIFIVGLFIGTSFIPNISGKILNNANILDGKKINNEEINTNNNILTVLPKGPMFIKFFMADIEITTYKSTEVFYSYNQGTLYSAIAILCRSDIFEPVATYSIRPIFGTPKDVTCKSIFGCIIYFFNGEFDFEVPIDEDGGHLKGRVILIGIT